MNSGKRFAGLYGGATALWWGFALTGLLTHGARGAEIAMVPVKASGVHTIDGLEITLEGGGQRITFDIRASGWDPDLDGEPLLKAWQVSLDSSGYTSGIRGTLTPSLVSCSGVCDGGINNGLTCIADADCDTCVDGSNDGLACNDNADCPGGFCDGLCDLSTGDETCRGALGGVCGGFTFTPGASCATHDDCPDISPPAFVGVCEGSMCQFPTGVGGFCEPGFILSNRSDYVFLAVDDISAVDLTSLDYRYASATQVDSVADPGDARYLGTLVLDVSPNARGTFEFGFKALPDTLLQDANSNFVLPLDLISVRVQIKCVSDAECDDDNLCTDDLCDVDGVCRNTPTFDELVFCCNPADGSAIPIDDGNECTEDICNRAGGFVDHPFKPIDSPCGNPASTECDKADACDAVGVCETRVEPDGTECGDPTDTECNARDTCDGSGTCQSNFDPNTTPCGDPSDTDCTAPDRCDGAGVCERNDAPDGTACDDGQFCTVGETCTAGACNGGAPRDCDDGLDCTVDTCDETADQCVNDRIGGRCVIDGTCRILGETNPANDCEQCDPALAPFGWSFKPAGSDCDDGDACTGTGRPGIGVDTCDGFGVCAGVVDPQCNDDCAFAVPVVEGVSTGNNDNRAEDDAEVSCQIDSNNDVWFVYTASCDGTVFVSTTGSQFAPSNDPVLSVHDACPGDGGLEIACDDDSGVNLQAALTFSATAGTPYWIRVAGFLDNTGDIVLNILPVDDCLIGGACFAAGAINPENECETCIPEVSTTSWSPRPEGSACGDPADTECDSPDACDGAGTCERNPKPDGTDCADEGNDCTFDFCEGGECAHPFVPAKTLCGDGADSECDHPDTCDGAGLCLPNFEPAETPCGEASDSQCDHPDICDGAGACDTNREPNGTPCNDLDICTGDDVCEDGLCAGVAIPTAPVVEAAGCRYLLVTPGPAGSPAPVALLLTSPAWPCLAKYVTSTGGLSTVPTFLLPDEWGTVAVSGADVVPSTPYNVEAECGVFLSPPGSATTALWGDIVGPIEQGIWAPPDGSVDVFDILAMVEAFENEPRAPSVEQADLAPCTPNGIIDIFDIIQLVDAFRGFPYPCAEPCAE